MNSASGAANIDVEYLDTSGIKIKRSEKPNCCKVLATKYLGKCALNIGLVVLIGLELYMLSQIFVRDDFLLAGLFAMACSISPVICANCYFYLAAVKEMNNIKDSKWYSVEEAEMFLRSLKEKKLKYKQRIICSAPRNGDEGMSKTVVLNEYEHVKYEDWVNLSQELDVGSHICCSVRKVYIQNSIEPIGDFSRDQLEARKQEFINARKDAGTSFVYSNEAINPEIPELILVTSRWKDNEPVIPCFYSQRLMKGCTRMGCGVFWQFLVENVFSNHYIYHNRNAISLKNISDQSKQEIEQMREKTKFKL